jgi:hypothetical protein
MIVTGTVRGFTVRICVRAWRKWYKMLVQPELIRNGLSLLYH